MQTDKNTKPFESFRSEQCKADKPHFVYISNSDGILLAFEAIKLKLSLSPNYCLTLIYNTQQEIYNPPLFKFELENLERRYPTQLFVNYIPSGYQKPNYNTEAIQQSIEIAINSNIRNQLKFILSVSSSFIESIVNLLLFLEIKTNQISQ